MIAVLDPVRYAAVYAKVHARMGQLLSLADWEALLAARDVTRFVEDLANTPYRDVVAYVQESRERRGPGGSEVLAVAEIERGLRGHLARAFLRPLRFVPEQPRGLLRWRWRQFELENLKILLRAVKQGVPPERTWSALVPLGDVSELPWEQLVAMSSVSDVVERLAGTFFGDALQPALDRYRETGRLLVLEIRLDLAYYRRLLNLIEALTGRDRREAERFLGMLVDSENIRWAFRYRDFYGLSREEIMTFCLHRGVDVDPATIRRIVQGARVVDVVTEIWGDRLSNSGRLIDLPDAEAVEQAERMVRRHLVEQAERIKGAYAMHLGGVLGYEVLLETEVHDLVTVIEGKVAGWSGRRVRRHLIGPYVRRAQG